MQKSKSFTLVELLVVIFIIGLLATLITIYVAGTRASARDAKRKADINSIKDAVELFINANGTPPGVADTDYRSDNANWDTLASSLSPYISPLPKDPLNGETATFIRSGAGGSPPDCDPCSTRSSDIARYWYITDGTDYEVMSMMEKDCSASHDEGGNSCNWYEVGSNVNGM